MLELTDTTTKIAKAIVDGFDRHYRLFRETSANAKERWERGEWSRVREAGRARIDMYDARVAETVAVLRARFPEAREEKHWPLLKRTFIALLHEHKQPECAETFFNSVARRVLDRRYYRNEYIFQRPAVSTEHLDGEEPTYRCHYPEGRDLRATFRKALEDFDLKCPFQDLERDLDRMQSVVDENLLPGRTPRPNFQVHVLHSLFFRNKAAYAVGRVVNGDHRLPFVVALLKDDAGKAYVDTLLLDPKNLGRLFSLGQAYFFVDMEVPSAYVEFLGDVVPGRPKAELYTMLGLQKQGKTLFFRDLEQHLRHSTDAFVLAPGTKGMVMVVFTLPSFPYVIKVIRDWFPPPKDADRSHVEERYRFVKLNDRVGRMSDTLEYAHVAFPRSRLDPSVMEELEKLAPSSIEQDGERIVVRHMYIERRLAPLDVYLAGADETKERAAIDEYGKALRELAGANIFPGDLLLKNFGLTRYGRVIFYDYDELCQVTDCRFRTLPRARDDADEMSAEPWFSVEPNDVFPEQFPTFLFQHERQRRLFLELHPDLTTAAFWNERQEKIRSGEQDDLFAYGQEIRFKNRFG